MRQEKVEPETAPLLDGRMRTGTIWDLSLQSRREKHGPNQLPLNIGHRGFKKRYPENTMTAFKGAIAAGADVLETDLHLSRDGVVVISHDPNLMRCFGVDKNIIDCDWEYLSTLQSTKSPHDPMPRLMDLLEYLASPERERILVLLDIKTDNDARTMMEGIAETLKVAPTYSVQWYMRIILGCWREEYFRLCDELLPSYPTAIISVNPLLARKYLKRPEVSFNILQKTLMGPLGYRFVEDAHAKQRIVLAWTVNSPRMMRWAIRKGVDGVITDDPETFGRIKNDWETTEQHIQDRTTIREYLLIAMLSIVIGSLSWLTQHRFAQRYLRFLVPSIRSLMRNTVRA